MKFDLLDWEPVMVSKSLYRQGVSHVIFDNFSSFSANHEVEGSWLKLNARDFFATQLGIKLCTFLLLFKIVELYLSIDSSDGN